MNPLIDEKMILSNAAVMAEAFSNHLGLECVREAYGPTVNEGICFEFCVQALFKGRSDGTFFLGMDGYTKILLLPYLSGKIKPDRSARDLNTSLVVVFVKKILKTLSDDIQEFQPRFSLGAVQLCSHDLIPLPTEKYRKYISIFFLKDEGKKRYLGRVYTILAFQK